LSLTTPTNFAAIPMDSLYNYRQNQENFSIESSQDKYEIHDHNETLDSTEDVDRLAVLFDRL